MVTPKATIRAMSVGEKMLVLANRNGGRASILLLLVRRSGWPHLIDWPLTIPTADCFLLVFHSSALRFGLRLLGEFGVSRECFLRRRILTVLDGPFPQCE